MDNSPTHHPTPFAPMLATLRRRSSVATAVLTIQAQLILLALLYNIALSCGLDPEVLGHALPPGTPYATVNLGNATFSIRVHDFFIPSRMPWLPLPTLLWLLAVWVWAIQASRFFGPLCDPRQLDRGERPPTRFSRYKSLWLVIYPVQPFLVFYYAKELWRHTHPGPGHARLTTLPVALFAVYLATKAVAPGIAPDATVDACIEYLVLELGLLLLGVAFIRRIDARIAGRVRWHQRTKPTDHAMA